MKTDEELTTLAKQCARSEWSEDNAFYYLSELQRDARAETLNQCANILSDEAFALSDRATKAFADKDAGQFDALRAAAAVVAQVSARLRTGRP